MIEVKEASKSFALGLSYVAKLFRVATQQGKDPVLVVQFPGYEVECRIKRTLK